MKKPNNKTQHDGRTRQSPRALRLHALIFGGTASATTPLGTSVPMPTGFPTIKWPEAESE